MTEKESNLFCFYIPKYLISFIFMISLLELLNEIYVLFENIYNLHIITVGLLYSINCIRYYVANTFGRNSLFFPIIAVILLVFIFRLKIISLFSLLTHFILSLYLYLTIFTFINLFILEFLIKLQLLPAYFLRLIIFYSESENSFFLDLQELVFMNSYLLNLHYTFFRLDGNSTFKNLDFFNHFILKIFFIIFIIAV